MTFYYHFKDIYDLVEWVCLEDAKKALEGQRTCDTWQQGFLQIFDMVLDNKPFITNVYHSIRRELILYKVRAKNSDDKNEIIQIANIFRGSIIDVSKETLTLSVIGDEKKTDAVQELLAEFGIVELVRTGMVALERGQFTIDEQTKVKGEYDYGKNVL